MDTSDKEARKSEDEEARKSEEILRKYCESHQSCEGCVFYKEWSGCGLTVRVDT